MKKITLISFLIALSFAMFAQPMRMDVASKGNFQALKEGGVEVNSLVTYFPKKDFNAVKAYGDTYYTEDFAGQLPTGWSTDDFSGNGIVWTWTDVGATGPSTSGYAHVLASTTAANGWMILDSDLAGSIDYDAVLQSPAFDFSGINAPFIVFEELYKRWGQETAVGNPTYIEVSTNGTDWWQIEIHASFDTKDETDNPGVMMVNLTPYAANEPVVYLRFRMAGNWDYWWQVDDMAIIEGPSDEMALVTPYISYYYLFGELWEYQTMVPKDQAWFYNFAAKAQNMGVFDQNDVSLHVTVENGVGVWYDNTQDSIGVWAAGSPEDTIFVDSTFYPYLLRGEYTVNYEIAMQNADQLPANNTASLPLEITDTTYGCDHGMVTNVISPWAFGGSDGDMIGTAYFFPAEDTLGSISVYVHNYTNPGVSMIAQVWKYDATLGEYLMIIDSEEYTITADDLDAWVTLDLTPDEAGQRIVAGGSDYYAMLTCYFGTDTIAFGADNSYSSSHSYQAVNWYKEGTTDYYYSNAPLIHLNVRRSVETCDPLFAELNYSNITCMGADDGMAEVAMVGGSGIPAILWSTGDTTESISNLVAGAYSVTVTNCPLIAPEDTIINFTISEPAEILNVSYTSVNPTCLNNDGSIDVSITGGVTPYTVEWSNGTVAEDLVGIGEGTYTFVMYDAYGCGDTGTIDFVIPSSPSISPITPTDTAHCSAYGATDAYIHITVTGGNTPYTYAWSNGATIEDLDNIGAGVYTIVVTDSLNCTATTSIQIVQPIPDNCDVAGSVSAQTQITCMGGSDGSATISATSTYAPVYYAWDNGETDATALMLDAGQHDCVLTDAAGCQNVVQVTIVDGDDIIITPTISDETVPYNGEISLAIANGTSPFTFTWSVADSVGQSISGLAGDAWYSVTVVDVDGCSKTGSFYVGQDPVCIVEIDTIMVNEPLCFNQYNGGAEVVMAAGYEPYTTSWSNGETTAISHYMNAGNYSVTISDYFGCEATGTFTVTQPAALVLSGTTSADTVGANTGAVDITVTGGTTPYAYTWTGGATTEDLSGLTSGTYSVTVADANNCKKYGTYVVSSIDTACVISIDSTYITNVACFGGNDGEITVFASGTAGTITYTLGGVDYSTSTISGLMANTYQLIVADTVCQAQASVTITEPDMIEITGSTTADVDGMNTGTVSITVIGGTTPYTFAWDNTSTDEDLTGLTAGTYAVIVSDANGCVADTVSFTVTSLTTCNLSISTATSDVLCFSGASGIATVTVSSGTEPYTVTWNGTAGDLDDSTLVAGQYIIQVTDANMCTDKDTIIIGQPTAAIAIAYVVDSADFQTANGSIDITVTGGTTPYSYAWPNGETTEDVSGLTGGQSYVVTVTDVNGCVKTRSILLPQRLPNCDISGSVAVTVDCFGDGQGTAIVTATTSNGAMTYLWNNSQNNDTIVGLTAGTYSVTVTDASQCTAVFSGTVTSPATPLDIVPIVTAIICNGDNNGAIDISVMGGTSPYSVEWASGSTATSLSNLSAGSYTVSATDQMGCVVTESINVTEPTPIAYSYSIDSTSICTVNLINVWGGSSPYTYLWSNGATTQDAENVGSISSLSVVITDADGCTLTSETFSGSCIGGFNEFDAASMIKIYPNPTSGILLVDNADNSVITVYDVLGKQLIEMNAKSTTESIDLTSYPIGTYIIRISGDNYSVTRRVVISK